MPAYATSEHLETIIWIFYVLSPIIAHCESTRCLATMTKRRSKAAKRKDTSAHESDLPDAKKCVSAETCNTSTFTRDLLKSLNDPYVRAAYQSILTDALLERISNLEEQVAENNTCIVSLEDELKTVSREKAVLEEDPHELRQYTRRNALRIYNLLWKEPPPPRPGQQGEDTDSLVLGLAHQLGVPLEPWEIGRSHRVGKPRNDGTPAPRNREVYIIQHPQSHLWR